MGTAKRLLVVTVVVVAGLSAVDALGDAFQARPDRVPPDSRSLVVFELHGNNYKHPLDEGADHLVSACSAVTARNILPDPGVEKLGPGRYRITVEPSLGNTTRLKLVGCLEDLTLDHLQADVVSVERVA